jgi:hypothetical protein
LLIGFFPIYALLDKDLSCTKEHKVFCIPVHGKDGGMRWPACCNSQCHAEKSLFYTHCSGSSFQSGSRSIGYVILWTLPDPDPLFLYGSGSRSVHLLLKMSVTEINTCKLKFRQIFSEKLTQRQLLIFTVYSGSDTRIRNKTLPSREALVSRERCEILSWIFKNMLPFQTLPRKGKAIKHIKQNRCSMLL